MNRLCYFIILCVVGVTLSYSDIDNKESIGIVSSNLIRQIQNFGSSPAYIDRFKRIIKNKSSCVVLIYTISDGNSTNNKADDNINNIANEIPNQEVNYDATIQYNNKYKNEVIHTKTEDKGKFDNPQEYFYNSAIQPRITKQSYKYGVTCGVVLSQDGIVVTTYNGTMNSDRYIVAIDSEKNQTDELYGEIELNHKTYDAYVIKEFPKLNLVFLRIKTNKSEKFDFLNLSNNSVLHNRKEESNYLVYSAVAIGKCKGEHFVKQRQTYNAKNKFNMITNIIGGIAYKKIKGVPTLVLHTPTTGDGAIPENHGGAIIDNDGKLLGIPVWQDYLNLPISFAIPASTIKMCLGLALPTVIRIETSSSCGIVAESLSKTQKKLLKQELRNSTKQLHDELLNNLKNNQISTNFKSINEFIDNNSFGVVVHKITEGSIADKANILKDDILLKFNNDCILDEETFSNLETHSINESQINLTLLRNNKIINMAIRK
ncbi:MAG: serine protease [Alphaproteobacteria bacterium]|nr:serine protease [Alphaproteobacteria bacterium]